MVSPGLMLMAVAQLSVDVSLSTQQLAPDDFLNVQIRAKGEAEGRLEIDVPEVEGLTEVGRSRREGTSFSISSSGRTMTKELVLSVDYSADRTGEITYPPVVARMGTEEARSKAVRLKVGGRAAPDRPPVPPAALPKGAVTAPEPDERDVFIRYVLSTDRAYTGAQVLVDMVLYSRGSPRDVDPDPPPSPDGAWRQMLGDQRRYPRGRAQVSGRSYQTVRLWRMALFGLQPGIIELPAYEAGIRMNSGPFARSKRLRRQAVPRQIEIRPLPEQGRPPNFSAGNVGQYRLRASVDQREVDASRGVLLKLEATGTGNLPQLQLPSVQGLDDFRVFPPTVTSDLESGADEVSGSKRVEVLLTPTRTGELVIPSLSLPTFDPEREAYVVLKSRPIPIRVTGRLAQGDTERLDRAAETKAERPPEALEQADQDPQLRPILPDPRLRPELDAIPLWALMGSLGTPWLAAACVVMLRRRRPRSAPERGRITPILDAARSGDPQAWILARRFVLTEAGFDPDTAPDAESVLARLALQDPAAEDRSLSALVQDVLTQAEAARFAPSLVAPPDAERLSALTRLEGAQA